MIALGTSSISVSFGDQVILDDISFSIENGDRLAIVGVNGAGKSTLLRVICGDLEPDKGQVFIDKTKKLGFLRQQLNFDSDKTVFDAMLSVFDEQISLERQMAELEAVLKNSQDEKDIARFAGLCEKYKLPRIVYVSNMDVDHASFRQVVEDMTATFGNKMAPFNLPIRENEKFVGYVNVITESTL